MTRAIGDFKFVSTCTNQSQKLNETLFKKTRSSSTQKKRLVEDFHLKHASQIVFMLTLFLKSMHLNKVCMK